MKVRFEVNVWRVNVNANMNVLLGLWGTLELWGNVRSCEAVEEGNCNLCYGVIILCHLPESCPLTYAYFR